MVDSIANGGGNIHMNPLPKGNTQKKEIQVKSNSIKQFNDTFEKKFNAEGAYTAGQSFFESAVYLKQEVAQHAGDIQHLDDWANRLKGLTDGNITLEDVKNVTSLNYSGNFIHLEGSPNARAEKQLQFKRNSQNQLDTKHTFKSDEFEDFKTNILDKTPGEFRTFLNKSAFEDINDFGKALGQIKKSLILATKNDGKSDTRLDKLLEDTQEKVDGLQTFKDTKRSQALGTLQDKLQGSSKKDPSAILTELNKEQKPNLGQKLLLPTLKAAVKRSNRELPTSMTEQPSSSAALPDLNKKFQRINNALRRFTKSQNFLKSSGLNTAKIDNTIATLKAQRALYKTAIAEKEPPVTNENQEIDKLINSALQNNGGDWTKVYDELNQLNLNTSQLDKIFGGDEDYADHKELQEAKGILADLGSITEKIHTAIDSNTINLYYNTQSFAEVDWKNLGLGQNTAEIKENISTNITDLENIDLEENTDKDVRSTRRDVNNAIKDWEFLLTKVPNNIV